MTRDNILLVIFSLLGIYVLAPDLDRHHGPLVSMAFALILILNSRPQRKYWGRYAAFIGVDMLTYYILFSPEPWDSILKGGLYESSAWPLVVCSLIMSLAGGLLLKDNSARIKYFLVTSGLQVPIAIFVGTPPLEDALVELSKVLEYDHYYYGAWQAWQFEWMLTYYLAVYFYSRPTPKTI